MSSQISDETFRGAVDASQSGDIARLSSLLDSHPRLLRERAMGPQAYRQYPYFLEPKLFWFVANNPTLVDRMPPNITEVAGMMVARGVEQPDLDYALTLVMTSSVAREQGHQLPLMRVLLQAGALATAQAILTTAGHGELEALRALIGSGYPVTATIAAALGDEETLKHLLTNATASDVQEAFGIAVINGHVESARIALDAGADVNAFLPVHSHGTALHAAALRENVALIDLLLERGARIDTHDKLWDATPLGWAIHEERPIARARLERVSRAN